MTSDNCKYKNHSTAFHVRFAKGEISSENMCTSFSDEVSTDSSDIDLGDSDDADDDLTNTSESLDDDSECKSEDGSFVEFDTIDEDIHEDVSKYESDDNCGIDNLTKHTLYTIIEEDEVPDEDITRSATPLLQMSALQKYFFLLAECDTKENCVL